MASYWDSINNRAQTNRTRAVSTKKQTPGGNWEAVFNPKVNVAANRSAYDRVLAANPGAQRNQAVAYVNSGAQRAANAPVSAVVPNPAVANNGGSGSSGGGGRGGGGGGGGVNPAIAAQAQMDYLTQLLGGKSYTANPLTAQRTALDNLRNTVTTASAADQQAATGAYNGLDTYLQGHQVNPYADVKLQAAQRAPDMNPYLASQGAPGTNVQDTNPEDGGYGAFQNVLALLGANQLSGNQSRLAESQMARTFSGQQIGAMDNAYLANITGQESGIAQQEAQAQAALDTEKRSAALQLAQLIAQGARAPDMAALGLA